MESWAEDYGNAVAHVFYNGFNLSTHLRHRPGNFTQESFLRRNDEYFGCENLLDWDVGRFIRLGYFHDLHDNVNTTWETVQNENVSRWTYAVQFQAFASNVRSYEQHRQAMQNIIAPQGFVNNLVRQHCAF